MTRIREELLAGSRLDDAAEVHHGHVVADVPHDGHVVGDEQHRQTEPLPQVGEQVEHRGLHRDVERRDGLVGDQDLGLERERAGDRDALPLTARELSRIGVERARRKAHEVEQLAAALRHAGARHEVVHAQQLGERLTHCHARVERRVGILEDHLHAPPVGRCALGR